MAPPDSAVIDFDDAAAPRAINDAAAQFNAATAQIDDALAQLNATPVAGSVTSSATSKTGATSKATRVDEPAPRERLVGRDIVCFANDWSGDPLSKKHVMRRLARHNRVLWVNSLGNRAPRATARDLGRIVDKLMKFAKQLDGNLVEVEHNIHVLAPLAIPSYRSKLARKLNELAVGAQVRAAMRKLGFHDPILYTFVPASAWVARKLGESFPSSITASTSTRSSPAPATRSRSSRPS